MYLRQSMRHQVQRGGEVGKGRESQADPLPSAEPVVGVGGLNLTTPGS